MIDEFDVDAAVRREWSSAAAFASDAPPKTRAVRAGTSPARARVDPAIVARLATLAEAFGASPVARDDERATRDDDDDDDDDDRWASPAASFMDDLCGCEQSEPTESSFREVRDRALEEATRATAAFDDGEKRKRVDEDEPVDEDEDEDEDERASTVTVSVPRLAVEAAYGDGDADGDAERLVVEVRGASAAAARATSSGDSVRVAVAYASATEHVRDGDATVRIPAFRVTPPSVDADDEPSRDPDERLRRRRRGGESLGDISRRAQTRSRGDRLGVRVRRTRVRVRRRPRAGEVPRARRRRVSRKSQPREGVRRVGGGRRADRASFLDGALRALRRRGASHRGRRFLATRVRGDGRALGDDPRPRGGRRREPDERRTRASSERRAIRTRTRRRFSVLRPSRGSSRGFRGRRARVRRRSSSSRRRLGRRRDFASSRGEGRTRKRRAPLESRVTRGS